jgi:hypothetical protein
MQKGIEKCSSADELEYSQTNQQGGNIQTQISNQIKSGASLTVGGRSGIPNAYSSTLRLIERAAASTGLGPASRVESHVAIVWGNGDTYGCVIVWLLLNPGAVESRLVAVRIRAIQLAGRSGRSTSGALLPPGAMLSRRIRLLLRHAREVSAIFSTSKSANADSGLGLSVVLRLSGGDPPTDELLRLLPFSERDQRWPA